MHFPTLGNLPIIGDVSLLPLITVSKYLKNAINLLTASIFTYFLLKGLPVEFSAICTTPHF
jgi:hypothetical protein